MAFSTAKPKKLNMSDELKRYKFRVSLPVREANGCIERARLISFSIDHWSLKEAQKDIFDLIDELKFCHGDEPTGVQPVASKKKVKNTKKSGKK